MIRVKTIHIEDLRGVRELDIDLDGKNFGICGPNGTGKSGVVDAIEFCLTGDVTRLSGQGTAGLSVKNHAPHVDQQGREGSAPDIGHKESDRGKAPVTKGTDRIRSLLLQSGLLHVGIRRAPWK